MKMTADLDAALARSTDAQRRDFCLRLWFELTVAGRIIVDDNSDPSIVVSGLVTINEIQHRLWHIHRDGVDRVAEELPQLLSDHAARNPCTAGPLAHALKRAAEYSLNQG